MKTLERFWHFVDNEQPAGGITREHLSKVARMALLLAEAQVAARAFGGLGGCLDWDKIWQVCSSADGTNPNARPEFFRPELVKAVRDLSLALCPALEAMQAAVPEAPPAPPPDFRRKYLSDWISPKATFTGRLLSAEYLRPPSAVVLHPEHWDELQEVLDRSTERQMALQQGSDYELRAAAYLRDVLPPGVKKLIDSGHITSQLVATDDGMKDLRALQPPLATQMVEQRRREQLEEEREHTFRDSKYLVRGF